MHHPLSYEEQRHLPIDLTIDSNLSITPTPTHPRSPVSLMHPSKSYKADSSVENSPSPPAQATENGNIFCNKTHPLTKAKVSIADNEIYYCSLCADVIPASDHVYQCPECADYGICSECYYGNTRLKRGKKRKLQTRTQTHSNKKRKICANNAEFDHYHIGLVLQSRKTNEKVIIRDYDKSTKLSHIWYLEKNRYLWIDLKNGKNNWVRVTDTNDVLIERAFLPSNDWKAPKLDLYQIIKVKTDMRMHESTDKNWWPAMIVGFCRFSRRHCIDYGDCTEWLWLDDSVWWYWKQKTPMDLRNKKQRYLSNKIPAKICPRFSPQMYRLSNEFCSMSLQMYVKRVKIASKWSAQMVKRVKARRNQKTVLENGHKMVVISGSESESEIVSDSDMKCIESSDSIDPFVHTYYDYQLSDKYIESDDSDSISDECVSVPKRRKRKRTKKRKKGYVFLPWAGNVETLDVLDSESDSEDIDMPPLVIYPYRNNATDHRKTPMSVECLIIELLHTHYSEYYNYNTTILDVSPYQCKIDCNDYTLYGNNVIFCNPNYSRAKPQIIQNIKHSKYNGNISVMLIPFAGNSVYWERYVWPNVDRQVSLQKFSFIGYDKPPMFTTQIVFFKPKHRRNRNGEHCIGHRNVKRWVRQTKRDSEYNKLKGIVKDKIVRFDDYLRENQPSVYGKLKREAKEYIEEHS